MSQWTSKNAILRDLSEAQGRSVPVDIVDTVGDGEKPPEPNFIDETEKEHFIGAEVALPSVPDFKLIRQWLNVVHHSNTSDDEAEEHTVCDNEHEYTPQKLVAKPPTNGLCRSSKNFSKRVGYNVAVQSILEAIANGRKHENQAKMDNVLNTENTLTGIGMLHKTVYPMKPDDGYSRQHSPGNTRPLALEPINMFKKKSSTKKAVANDKSESYIEKNENIASYKPTELASEYYKKYKEREQIREAQQNDIWTKAEKKMKEIDERRKSQASQLAQTSNSNKDTSFNVWDEINLAEHRHLSKGDCVVCEALLRHGYHIDITE